MITIQLKNNGRRYWVDDVVEENGFYVFDYIQKDGTVEHTKIATDAVESYVETSGTVKENFKKPRKVKVETEEE